MASSQFTKTLPSTVATAKPPIPNQLVGPPLSVDRVLDLDLSDDSSTSLSTSSVIAPAQTAQLPLPTQSPSLPPTPPSAAPPSLDLVNHSIVFLDPWLLRFSEAHNRDEASFDTPDFKELLRSVIAHRGNLQPICVVERIDAAEQRFHEVVFGERRVRACREAGVEVRAMVMQSHSSIDNALLRLGENRGRRELTPLEFGRQVKHVLDDPGNGLNRTQLAKILGCHAGHVGRAYELASLPCAILEAFETPLELQYAHMLPLKRAYQAAPAAVLSEAELIREELDPPTTVGVIERLEQAAQRAQTGQLAKEGGASEAEDGGGQGLASGKSAPAARPPQPIRAKGQDIGSWVVLPNGAITLQINSPMSQFQREELIAVMVAQLELEVLKTATANEAAEASSAGAVQVPVTGEQA
ncbi:ParB/RepB/Spo0J family partition protein [Roseateles oligotrophus]|uniref:ParB/RepB/Spo0J family partition protein n=1 Tax=Roseateles oligotrophus TaxID=1769250 RepID=A0ABT2YC98_9BURK|nr:ParB/RepB/Spo0J family partition protein [Roseateles oligotrophus]MCV2367667.1 ParB/RepB/Spo0J family partition protein [Roseateles oligotrophus]